jgi:hypothetical protein
VKVKREEDMSDENSEMAREGKEAVVARACPSSDVGGREV